MTFIPPSRRTSDPVFHAVVSAAVSLAIGLPFLFILTRAAQFYGYADSGFGFWLAKRALPVWAFLSVGIGVIAGIWSARRRRTPGAVFVRSGLASLLVALTLTAATLAGTSSLRKSGGMSAGLPHTPLGHFLSRHLFESAPGRKLDFDPCVLDGAQPLVLNYQFCIPDSSRQREEVSAIDTTVRFADSSCAHGRILCLGSSRQGNARSVLRRLSQLPYVSRILGTASEPSHKPDGSW